MIRCRGGRGGGYLRLDFFRSEPTGVVTRRHGVRAKPVMFSKLNHKSMDSTYMNLWTHPLNQLSNYILIHSSIFQLHTHPLIHWFNYILIHSSILTHPLIHFLTTYSSTHPPPIHSKTSEKPLVCFNVSCESA